MYYAPSELAVIAAQASAALRATAHNIYYDIFSPKLPVIPEPRDEVSGISLFTTHLFPLPIRNEKSLTEVKPLELFAVPIIELGVGKFQILERRIRFRELQTQGCRCRVLSCSAC